MSLKKHESTITTTLAILSIALCFFWYLSIPAGIISLILSIKQIKAEGKTAAKVNAVLSIIGICTCYTLYINAIALIILSIL